MAYDQSMFSVGTNTPFSSTGISNNGYTGSTQTQMLSDGNSLATLTTTIDKGGMRGIALLAAAIAEFELKNQAADLAQNYYNLNRSDYQFFTNHHQPAIAETAAEAFNTTLNPTYTFDLYASLPGGMAQALIVDRQWYEARRRIPKYNIGQQRRLDYDFAVLHLHAVASGWNAGTRYEQAWTDAHNNRAFDRKIAVANIGLGIGAIVRQGLASAVSKLESSYDYLGDTVATIGNGYAASRGQNDAMSQIKSMFSATPMR